MKKNMSWKFTDELSVTFQLSISGAGEFGLSGTFKSTTNSDTIGLACTIKSITISSTFECATMKDA